MPDKNKDNFLKAQRVSYTFMKSPSEFNKLFIYIDNTSFLVIFVFKS
jgi:hypothetical protein